MHHIPPKELRAFPLAERVRGKSRYAGGLRARWVGPDGTIYEWDYQHGHVEVYDARGNHQGAVDAVTGSKVSEAVNTRRVEP